MRLATQAWPGKPFPLGAHYDGSGVNFAVFSEHARAVWVCLFDDQGEETRMLLAERTGHVFHTYVPGLRPGQRYGLRVDGPYDPANGLRMNAHKLLVDPYARELSGKVDYRAPVFGYDRPARAPGAKAVPYDDRVMSTQDSAAGVPKSVVVAEDFDWGGDARPDVPWADVVVYEAHVKGFSMTNPDVPEPLRGTYLGLAADASIAHLKSIGVTTVELLPVHEHADEPELAARGMTNYWGYSTLSFFAPDQRFATAPGKQVREFREMVKKLHAAGIEVVLDVVYNHTCEGGVLGPTLSLRGIDNKVYYRLVPGNQRLYEDFTGCGNSLDVRHPETLRLIMDSLRYWVTEMHVDGFRFDLASTLAREGAGVDKMSSFFDIIHQDPVLRAVKLIAEPWDLGEGGYQVGNFPVLWREWNGKYRDCVRRFWLGDKWKISEMGYRLTGSSDLYATDGRHPQASINFVTAHDGFTLYDWASYQKKHNEANGEENRDGMDDNASANHGVEGETMDARILDTRLRQVRNMLTTLMLSQGVPMLTSGDEMGKTQHGNNNAYVQDNAIGWLDWRTSEREKSLLAFTKKLVALRAAHPVFRRPSFLRGERWGGSHLKDIAWFAPSGTEMTISDWQNPAASVIGLLLAGDALGFRDAHGIPVIDDTFFVIMSAAADDFTFTIPSDAWADAWQPVLDTSAPDGEPTRFRAAKITTGERIKIPARSVLVLQRIAPERGSWRPMKAAPLSAPS
jgi:glycogen operon protein